jgi:hypothetical protein
MPEFAIDLPGSGLPPSDAAQQLGYGERQGPDSNRPEIQGRIVGQWQLDHAPGVAPAQIIFSGFNGKRTAIVLAADVPSGYAANFSTAVSASSKQDGWDAEWQLPTRWFTLTGKYYSGGDLRWFFGGQLNSFFNDTAGLCNTYAVASEDGASTVYFGTNAHGQQVVAPERPIRGAGGFVQLGLPLSRIFHAGPVQGQALPLFRGVPSPSGTTCARRPAQSSPSSFPRPMLLRSRNLQLRLPKAGSFPGLCGIQPHRPGSGEGGLLMTFRQKHLYSYCVRVMLSIFRVSAECLPVAGQPAQHGPEPRGGEEANSSAAAQPFDFFRLLSGKEGCPH